ncbi:hypothetical protein MJO28_002833 [Puccinia striiformis f. sp. tritici]|uniref:Peroxisomal membrane protein 4 n=4 Tax=Puccinia striiformis TaxID=27350 RepID=A0A0L0VK26_9BASI|nr:hypothetical protein Pst134EA_005207 [Puccinia striiformis f. sp. tritici]KAI9619309.1 hypothetical protein H4Q26_011993 [Puccinia striiformis f. sp. tritici PST-130]KNE99630.1 hypothetical protein PSTG_07123 [Puccinia striiformis f. sp. tritici PST-78]POW01058.1 hypothetical protein PSTT_12758 [Puccinia striiformis]KAH9471304.1 hypothetical protein Pst134EA_005207 [Puccinia striiformis f. sp. tritici]KAI7959042.1 hypothetical protein MJO28_002833 [Puccinia striiformis f. sp. tritici]
MESLNTFINEPRYHNILSILKGARNGLVYGAKIRFPHALVMTLIFHGNRPWKDRVRFVVNATRQHALNLCKFVTIYKTALLLQRKLNQGKERSADTFLAGLVGGWLVFGERNAINEQIVLYCVSRVVSSFLPRASSSSGSSRPGIIVTQNTPSPSGMKQLPPLGNGNLGPNGMPRPPGFPYPTSVPIDKRIFEIYAAITWGAVMWLFRWRRERLAGGLINSMQYLYLDSEVWTNLKNLLWYNVA